jgi:UDPglucose 6-dehydrogenase
MGYVGLTTGLGLAKLGHKVVGVEISRPKLELLKSGRLPIFEPGLEDVLEDSLASGYFELTDSLEVAASKSKIIFVCLPTPQDNSGAADLSFVKSASLEISKYAQPGTIVVIKSTVPVGSGSYLKSLIGREDIFFASNPEFLREGTALEDFINPDRVIVGAERADVAREILDLYDQVETTKISTSVESAELIKYASNAYLASRLSFINDISFFCERVGANIDDVIAGMGSDSRIGRSYLAPGPGWGGSCFPKDTRALLAMATSLGVSLGIVNASIVSNEASLSRVVERVKIHFDGDLEGKVIAIWGLAFKSNTDDTRDSPSLEIISKLLALGCQVRAFDPQALAPDWENLVQTQSAVSATDGADGLLVLTEWQEFSDIEPASVMHRMNGSFVLDTRRVLSESAWREFFTNFQALGAQ